jgi:hypothetical protein
LQGTQTATELNFDSVVVSRTSFAQGQLRALQIGRAVNAVRTKRCYDIAMFGMKLLAALVVCWMVASATGAAQQQPESVPPPWEIAPPVRSLPVQEIHVDQNCAFLTYTNPAAPGVKPKKAYFPDFCHLETILDSHHREEAISGEEMRQWNVEIREQEYVLQNASAAPVVFVIEHFVPKDWKVDSDPQPVRYDGSSAIFRPQAAPGEIVRLHVGMRHESHPRTRHLKPLPPALAGFSRN